MFSMMATRVNRVTRIPLAKSDLLQACASGDVEYVSKFVETHRERKYYSIADEDVWGPLHHAVSSKSYDCVRALLSTKLMNVEIRTRFFNDSCLEFAMADKRLPRDIIALMLENDPEFYLIRTDLNSFVQMPVGILIPIVDTLRRMKIPFAIAFNLWFKTIWLARYGFRMYRHQVEIFSAILFNCLAYEEANEFMQHSADTISGIVGHAPEVARFMFTWFIQNVHRRQSNQHSDLVENLLKNPVPSFDHHILFALHSDIHVNRNEYTARIFLAKILSRLVKVDLVHRDAIAQVVDVLWTKFNGKIITEAFQAAFVENQELLNKMPSIEWFDVMQIGDKIDIGALPLRNLREIETIFNTLMPFSTEDCADGHLSRIRLELGESDAIGISDELAKFCVAGVYQTKSMLKGLCRATIRKSLLQAMTTTKSHANLVSAIRSLELPKSIQRFLLFNYTVYEF